MLRGHVVNAGQVLVYLFVPLRLKTVLDCHRRDGLLEQEQQCAPKNWFPLSLGLLP
jgi:hypothetical protein